MLTEVSKTEEFYKIKCFYINKISKMTTKNIQKQFILQDFIVSLFCII